MASSVSSVQRATLQRVAFGCLGVLALWLVGVESVSDAFIQLPPPCVGREMLRFKDDVEIKFTLANQKIIGAAEYAHEQHGHACIVTAGKDGRHQHDSKHYDSQALDFRTWHLSGQPNPCLSLDQCSPICKAILGDIKMRLGKDFDVIFEPDAYGIDGKQIKYQHIHAEFDPKP